MLVHGAWHGGWCWQRLAPLLCDAGHRVYTPTLTGLGERAHLANPEVGLNTHIQDILAVLEYEDLREVVLVGHSYGGMVITGVANQAAERLSQLIYLDAIIPQDGQSMADIIGPQAISDIRQAAKAVGEGWHFPSLPIERFGITTDADIAFVKPRLVHQPLKTFEEPVRLTHPGAMTLLHTYIYLNRPAMGNFEDFAEMAQMSQDWGYYELATGHDAMVLEPRKLADLLIIIAEEEGEKK